MKKNQAPPPQKPAPKGLKVLLTAAFGTAVIGIIAICIALAKNQSSTLMMGMALLGVAAALGVVLLNVMFPRKPRG